MPPIETVLVRLWRVLRKGSRDHEYVAADTLAILYDMVPNSDELVEVLDWGLVRMEVVEEA